MSSEAERAHCDLGSSVAEEYRQLGFDVVLHPQAADLPFDFGTYRPDLIARNSSGQNYIIEVRDFATRTPIDRFREIAETVSQHPGWSFLLITREDAPPHYCDGRSELLSWKQMRECLAKSQRLMSQGAIDAAFLSLWPILEAALRRRAIEILIPIERFPTLSLINHLYSQGELSIEQLMHGNQPPDLSEPTMQLFALIDLLVNSWASDQH